jgi:hypothetical protein
VHLVKIVLRAHKFTLTLEPGRPAQNRQQHDGQFIGRLSLVSGVPRVTQVIESPVRFLMSDLQRLSEWIDRHLDGLLTNPHWATPEWVSWDLSIQVALLEGSIEQDDGGYKGTMSLRVLLAIDSDASGTLYGGYEGSIDPAEVARFSAALREYAAESSQG